MWAQGIPTLRRVQREVGQEVHTVLQSDKSNDKEKQKMRNPFTREARPITLTGIKIPVGAGYTMNGTVVDVIHELQENIIIIERDRTRLRNALNAKQEEVDKLHEEIASLNRRIFQMKHEAKAR